MIEYEIPFIKCITETEEEVRLRFNDYVAQFIDVKWAKNLLFKPKFIEVKFPSF